MVGIGRRSSQAAAPLSAVGQPQTSRVQWDLAGQTDSLGSPPISNGVDLLRGSYILFSRIFLYPTEWIMHTVATHRMHPSRTYYMHGVEVAAP